MSNYLVKEYLERSRRKAAKLLNIDSRRLGMEHPSRKEAQDAYLVELKGFRKRTDNQG